MSKHLFGIVITPYGPAANNRGDNEGGNITTLQKLLWKGETHTTVSSEAIRWAIRYFWQRKLGAESVNRVWNADDSEHKWTDDKWKGWNPDAAGGVIFGDDDVMGFMEALAGSEETDTHHSIPRRQKELRDAIDEAEDSEDAASLHKAKKQQEGFEGNLVQLRKAWDDLRKLPAEQREKTQEIQKKIKGLRKKMELKGVTLNRRGPLEVARAISLTPWSGDLMFSARSGQKTSTSLYNAEVHATRYQFGFALTPEELRRRDMALHVVDAITNLAEVGGNHARFLYDFSPDSVIFRWTDDFAPRMLYAFECGDDGTMTVPEVLRRAKSGDIKPAEIIVGGKLADCADGRILKDLGAFVESGVGKAAKEVKRRMHSDLGLEDGDSNGQ